MRFRIGLEAFRPRLIHGLLHPQRILGFSRDSNGDCHASERVQVLGSYDLELIPPGDRIDGDVIHSSDLPRTDLLNRSHEAFFAVPIARNAVRVVLVGQTVTSQRPGNTYERITQLCKVLRGEGNVVIRTPTHTVRRTKPLQHRLRPRPSYCSPQSFTCDLHPHFKTPGRDCTRVTA